MKLKGVVLGVAGALAVTGAQAADLPAAPEPVDYVRVCDAFGSGFLYIPGTETCFRIQGRVRADYWTKFYGPANAAGGPTLSWDKGSVNGYRFRARGYLYADTRTNTEWGLLRSYEEVWFTNDNSGSSSLNLWQAFVQFGGLTFGRTYSFYDFYTIPTFAAAYEAAHSDAPTNLAAYTFAFGNGFSASFSVEDGNPKKNSVWNATTGTYASTGGLKMPDLVANIRVDQGWGSAQVMAALTEVRTNSKSEIGFAIAGGVTANLPMLGEGDELGIQAGYSLGKLGYTAPNPWAPGNRVVDGSVRNGKLDLTSSWAIAAGFQHFWTPQLSSGIGASYLGVDVPHGKNLDYSNWDVQGNLVYSPIRGLQLGAELEWKLIDPERKGGDTRDVLLGLLRVQRSF